MSKLAVVLFNLGGPDGPEAVRPFLENLFKDPAIIGLPALFRLPLARFIASQREETAKANYAIMGGASPLLPETRRQAAALQEALATARPDLTVQVFISMRYWKPFAEETAREVAAFAPDDLVLLPLYPQFSTTTTASSFKAWAQAYRGPGRPHAVCCYPNAQGLAEAHARAISQTWLKAGRPSNVRLLFSAHGLPQKVIDGGDPYQLQVEASARAIAARLPELTDWSICYQSRVGPLKWIGPSTEEAVRQAAAEGKGVLICPVAFVSEHVETLVELDHEYAAIARELGVTTYLRAPTPTTDASLIDTFVQASLEALERGPEPAPFGPWLCPPSHAKCVCQGKGGGASR